MGVQITLGVTVYNFFTCVPTREIAGSYVNSIFNFWGTCVLFSIIAVTIYSSTNRAQMFTFLHILINSLFLVFLTITGLMWYLICISLMFSNIEHLFMYSLEICISSLKNFPFISYIYFLFKFFYIGYYEFCIHFEYQLLTRYMACKHCFKLCRLTFKFLFIYLFCCAEGF